MKRRVLATILSLALILSLIPGFTVSADGPDVSISTAQELVDFATASKSDNYSGKTIVLTADIDMSGVTDFPMIGSFGTKFAGTFDGQNHVISGLTIDTTLEYAGLFSCTDNALVKDFTLTDSSFSSNNKHFGAIAGFTENVSTFSGITVTNTVTVAGGGQAYVGGMIGRIARNTVVENCVINAAVSNTIHSTGGLAGCADLVGTPGIQIRNTVVGATVTASGQQCIGGFIGRIHANANPNVTITNCEFTGSVMAGDTVGGIIGGRLSFTAGSTTNPIVIRNCKVTGSVTGARQVGGIIGRTSFATTIENCTVTANVTSTGAYQDPYIGTGGIIGKVQNDGAEGYVAYNVLVKDCFYNGTVESAGGRAGGIVGYSDAKNVTVTVDGCVTAGTIGKAGTYMNGGILGASNNTGLLTFVMEDCISVNTLVGNNTAGLIAQVAPNSASSSFTANRCFYTGANWALMDATPTETNAMIVEIDNETELVNLAKASKVATIYGGTVRLTGDLDLDGVAFPMFGLNASLPFQADFDGQGHTIRNLTLNGSSEYTGLCTVLGNAGIVENLTFSDSTFTSTAAHLGAVAGLSWYASTIRDVIVDETCLITSTTSFVGGIAGRIARDAQVIDCEVKGTVNGAHRVGGIVGVADLAPSAEGCKVMNCTFSGLVSADGGASGIISMVHQNAAPTVTITGCKVTGEINSGSTTMAGSGGIVGVVNGATTVLNISNCIVSATFTAKEGVAASRQGGILAQPNNGTITINDCLFTGTLSTVGNGGGIVGRPENGSPTVTINRCFSSGLITGTNKGVVIGSIGTGTVNVNGCYGVSSSTAKTIGAGSAASETNTGCSSAEADYAGVKARVNAPALFANGGEAYWKSVPGKLPELETFAEAADEVTVVYYSDISSYRGATYTAPAGPAGTIFAGWFTDEALTTALAEDVTSGAAYAKFADASLLTVKIQELAEGGNNKLRIVTSVESLDVKSIGFTLDYLNASNVAKHMEQETITVYRELTGFTDSGSETYKPSVFSKEATHFCCYKLCASETLANAITANASLAVTPFWTTPDGTKVTGTARTGLKFTGNVPNN